MPDHDPRSADAEWKKIQQRTFTRWCNEHLKVANIVIYDLETDLCDGIKLIVLLEILSHKRVGKYNKKPNFKSQKLENVDIALKFIKNENIRLVNNNVSDIVKGNLKIILGLIWRLIAKYQISMPMGNYKFDDDDGKGGKKKDSRMTPKQVLLAWVKRKMPPEIPMNNFTTDWNDGRAIAALVDAVEPGLFPDVDPKYLDPNDAVNNAKKAMNTADKYLGVPPVLDAADMCNPKVDEMSVMTYVSYFPKAKCKPGAPHRPQLPAAAKYSAEGPGITPEGLVAKQPVPFTVFTAGAGKGTPQVNVFGPERSNITCEVVDNGDKTSSCNYTPPEQDRPPSFSPDLYQDRRMVKRNKKQKSRSTLCLLVFLGCAIMFFALVLIYSSFAINNDEDFDFDNDQLEARIQSQFNYNQYWAGVPFFVIGTLVLFSGIFQRSRRLTMTSVIFCVVSVALTLFILALDSANFFYWNSLERSRSYWDSKSGYSCGTDNASKACTCLNSSSSQTISVYECNIVRKLSALYGAVVASAIMVTLFSMAAITVLIKSLS